MAMALFVCLCLSKLHVGICGKRAVFLLKGESSDVDARRLGALSEGWCLRVCVMPEAIFVSLIFPLVLSNAE